MRPLAGEAEGHQAVGEAEGHQAVGCVIISKMVVKVRGLPMSTCTTRVLACLEEKGIEYHLLPVHLMNGAHKKPDFLALNPFGQIPVLEDEDLTLFESRAIVRYLAWNYQGQGTDLLGKTAKEQAFVEVWSEVESQQFNGPCSAVVFQIVISPKMGGQTDPSVVESNLEKLKKVLDVYEERLSKSKYLAGDFFSLADLQHLPYLHYLVNDSGNHELVTARKHVNAWWEDISSRPAWKKIAEHMKFH